MYAAQVDYAGFWIRFAAAFIDGIIVGVALFVIFFVIGIIVAISAGATASSPDFSGGGVNLLANVIYFVLYAGYFVYFWGMGQTPAMRWLGLYVADANTGGPIGFGKASIRLLGYMLSVLICYIGLIWAAFDPRKQGWHDHIAGSVVIRG